VSPDLTRDLRPDRPYVTLKLATSLDGRIATASGESRWITGEAARRAGHALRAAHDAVLVGVETALADDPELTVRTPGYDGAQPLRVVLDSRQRIGEALKLVAGARELPTLLLTTTEPQARLADAGVRVVRVAARDGRVDLSAAMAALFAAGVRRLLVEGGGEVASSFVRHHLCDAVEWFRAPLLLGADGRPGLGAFGLSALADAPRLKRVAVEALGEDLRERYEAA
jgi:diaminohydroxyphosphoribosylaminopyrimidine deaminase/5-amino-6-(5-phosphoribosylamino)uracil reductase